MLLSKSSLAFLCIYREPHIPIIIQRRCLYWSDRPRGRLHQGTLGVQKGPPPPRVWRRRVRRPSHLHAARLQPPQEPLGRAPPPSPSTPRTGEPPAARQRHPCLLRQGRGKPHHIDWLLSETSRPDKCPVSGRTFFPFFLLLCLGLYSGNHISVCTPHHMHGATEHEIQKILDRTISRSAIKSQTLRRHEHFWGGPKGLGWLCPLGVSLFFCSSWYLLKEVCWQGSKS